MAEPPEYEHELTASRDDIAAVLTGVADGLRAGAVRLGDDEEAVTVTMPEELTLDLELEQDGDEIELEIELEWPTDAETASASSVEDSTHDAAGETDSVETPDSDSVEPTTTTRDIDAVEADDTPPNNSGQDVAPRSETESTDDVVAEGEKGEADTAVADESIDESTRVGDADETESGGDIPPETLSLVGAADKSQSLAQFEVYRARDDKWRWRLRHRNGNIIATSGQGYTRKHNAVKGLRSVMMNSPDAPISQDAATSWPVE